MLKQRVITAIGLAVLFLGALFFLSVQGFAITIAAVVMLAGWEWGNIVGLKAQWQRWLYAALVGVVMVAAGWYTQLIQTGELSMAPLRALLLGACTWWAVALLWVQGYPSSTVLWSHPVVKAVMGILVLVPTWLSLVFLRSESQGEWLILLVVLIVVCADIGAYFSGRALGKHKLAPAVSPGKTWEGMWGGFICCLILALVVGLGFSGGWWVLAIVAPTSLASVLGDLLESMVKRQRGIKDSSQLLPGHGGILDRVDSLTAAAPVFALAVLLTGWQV
ncbi:phosphatidate cytidylyltransferase [Aestuariicella hydrocarbonica]|uniref:Phosphatidate cytidylyltransferase n=1 Tax=Pseudomaricurvus hydrocarbonicus TaxID=1470433 RepID=A0A9E5MLB4_9GAMM|nr:phosphatidate cytidylyltransferase [Aestuariicella hydrocarbonica]NHO64193.1 phosphatidate cytidylyltransferase [Aestuariicella hydrocarbonica]